MNSNQELYSWRGSFLKYVLALGFVTLTAFSVEYWLNGRQVYAISELVMGVVMLVVYLLLVFKKINWKTAAYFGWSGILFILFMVLMYGGIGGVGLAWWGLLPMLSFMFFGIEWGLVFTIAGSLIPIVVMLVEYGGVDISFFDVLQIRQLLLMIFVMGAIMSSYERAVRVLLKKLSDDSERITSEAEERAVVEQELAQKLLELSKRSEKDEKVRLAVMNILEDERTLEAQLKKEKAGVEIKIEERTKELFEEKQRLFKFLNSIPQGVFVLTKDGKPFFANDTAKEILGKGVVDVSTDEVIQEYRIYRAGTNELYDIKNQPSVKALRGEISTVSDMEVARDDKRIPIRVTGAPIYNSDKTIEYAIVVFSDITEESILNRSRDEFFSIASHELRTPLTAIRGNTEMILDNYKDKIKDKDVLEMLSDVHEGSVRLIEIVNDFLNVSRLEMGKIDFKIEEFNLIEVLNETIEEFRASNIKPDLELKVVCSKKEILVSADRDRLKQVLVNLIGNAFKFTEAGGVYFEGFDVKDGRLNVEVRDTGAGIAPEQQALLFRKFQQAGDSLYTRDTSKGTGLGLYISRLLMDGMKGSIELKFSQPKKGSVFCLQLPVAK